MEKINIAELLKDCPKGMELNCTMFENVTFEGIKQGEYPITVKIKKPSVYLRLTKNGCWNSCNSAKCVIFPKGETTWEGFVPPCKFKDGDVLVHTQNDRFIMSIYKSNKNEQLINTHAILWDREEGLSVGMQICCYTDNVRLATEEEKQKLFDAIKANGYKWNEETKTLKKLPKFKVGDKIQCMDYKVKITEVNIEDECYEYESIFAKGIGGIAFSEQDNWELVPDIKPKFKVGDVIQHKENTGWVCTIARVADRYYVEGHPTCYSIPFDKQDEYELIINKFDITTLKTFDKVLVRQSVHGIWGIDFFGFYNYDEGYYYTTSNCAYTQCIPYEQNKHLLGTTKDCDVLYKNW